MPKFSIGAIIQNISNAFAPFFSFSLVYDSIFLAPLFGLATVTLVIIGILASVGKMYMSRNSVVSLLAIYAIFLSGLNGDVAITVIIPIAILTAAGFESIVDKWYSLFPENPYAHLFGIVPMVVIIAMIVGSGLSHFVYGYHYAPRVANNFNNDLTIITNNVNKETPILITEDTQNGKFYSLLAKYEGYKIISENSSVDEYVTFTAKKDEKFALKQIITSPKSRNSDRLYIYSKVTEQEERGEK